jgi:antitoxin ParD1/3/4
MTIQLKLGQEKFIIEKIDSGEYSSADDVIAQAFQLLELREIKVKELRDKIGVGTEQIINGQVTDGNIVFARLQEKIDKITVEQNS